MTILRLELRRGRLSLLIWTGIIAFMLAVSIFLFPEMRGQMDELSAMMSSMGSFSEMFGMDQLSFGTMSGYYTVECGNVLGLGGAFFAALCAVGVLSKEEKDRTAEFLLAHPVSRVRVVTEKLLSVLAQITALNAAVMAVALLSVVAIGEDVPWREVGLLHLAYYFMQLEIAGICFGISAFLRKGSIGVGLGLAALLYFLNLIANITESVAFLNYVTPFGYCDGAQISADGSLAWAKVGIGLALGCIGVAGAYWRYPRKDIFC